MGELSVPDASTEKEFLMKALAVWLQAHDKPVPCEEDLARAITYYSPDQDQDVLTPEDESVCEDGE